MRTAAAISHTPVTSTHWIWKRSRLGPRPKGKRAARGNAPKFDLRTKLYRIPGVDWSQVDGIDVQVARSAIAEVGVDLKAFPAKSISLIGWDCAPPTRPVAAEY
jgi:hypothetical protein